MSAPTGFVLAVPWGAQVPKRICICKKRCTVKCRLAGEWYYALCVNCGAKGLETLTKDSAALDWDKIGYGAL